MILIMFEKTVKKEQKEEDMPVSREELANFKIKIPMSRKELTDHLAMLERKKALGESRGQGETPAMTPEEIEQAEAALARNQEMGGK